MQEAKASVKPQSIHEMIASEIMAQLSYEEIPGFLRQLHKELTARFETMAKDAELEAEYRSHLYIGIRDAFDHEVPPPKASR